MSDSDIVESDDSNDIVVDSESPRKNAKISLENSIIDEDDEGESGKHSQKSSEKKEIIPEKEESQDNILNHLEVKDKESNHQIKEIANEKQIILDSENKIKIQSETKKNIQQNDKEIPVKEPKEKEIIKLDSKGNMREKEIIKLDSKEIMKTNSFIKKVPTVNNYKKKDTDDISMNIELNAKNEFFNMDHFDEASKIGFGVTEEDEHFTGKKSKFNDINSSIKEKEYTTYNQAKNDNDLEQIKNIRLHLDNEVLLFSEIKNFKSFKKFMRDKVKYYVKSEAILNNKQETQSEASSIQNEILKKSEPKTEKKSKREKDNSIGNYHTNNIFNLKKKKTNIQKKVEDKNYHSYSDLPSKNKKKEVKFSATARGPKTNENDHFLQRIKELEEELDKKNKEIEKQNEKLKKYLDAYDEARQEKEGIEVKLENALDELNVEKTDNQKKADKILELTERNVFLEQSLKEAKNKINFESASSKENKQNYDSIKSNFMEIKNQYELLNIKYQSVSDENFNYKRDMLLYEKEIKNKNEMIQKLRNNLLESNRRSLNDLPKNEVLDDNLELTEQTEEKEKSNKTFKTIIDKKSEEKEEKKLTKEEQIKLLENEIVKLNKDREDLNNELNKIPEHPKKRELIDKRKNMENKVDSISSELSKKKIILNSLKQTE